MSTRRLLNITTGAVALLLVGAAILSLTEGRNASDAAGVELATGQTATLADLQRDARDLASAADLADVNAARERLGASILRFDRTLSALINGGTVARPDGTTVRVEPVADQTVRDALDRAVVSWRRIGVPLADLAAGAFSAYSAAGQSALAGLEAGRPALAGQLEDVDTALQSSVQTRTSRTKSARALAVGLALLLAVLFILRRFLASGAPAPREAHAAASTHDPIEAPALRPIAPAAARTAPSHPPVAAPSLPLQPYTSPVDLEDVSLAVDRLAVDLNAIATNSDKMRTAIDSVGHALQGMLFSLKEMAKDTAEGDRLVSGAHSAAGYTRDVADALAASVREMGTVVASVSDLARRTRETADRIATESAHSERTGQGYTRAMANEIRSLAQHTGGATMEIEETVSSMLAVNREYEEAIGEILQHVSAINKVSRGLGEVMLDPPAPEIVPAPSLAIDEETIETAGAEEDLGDVTAAAIAEAAEALDEKPEDAPEKPVDEPVAEAVEAVEAVEETVEEEPEAAEEPATEDDDAPAVFSLETEGEQAPEASADQPKVFMLSKPTIPADEPEAAAEPEPEPAVESETEPAAEAEPEDAIEPAAAVEPEPEPVAEPEVEVEIEPEDAVEPAPEPEVAVEAEPEPVPEEATTEPAADDEGNPNVFILNKPRKAVPETVPPEDGD